MKIRNQILIALLVLLVTVAMCAVSCTDEELPDETTGGDTESQTSISDGDTETTAAPTDEETEPDMEPDTELDNQPEDTSPDGVVVADVYPTPTEITYGNL